VKRATADIALGAKTDPIGGSILLNQWDSTAKRDAQGMPLFIELAELDFQTKVTSHQVASQRDSYVFQFEMVGGVEYDDAPDTNN
jgi:hypothetical protein